MSAQSRGLESVSAGAEGSCGLSWGEVVRLVLLKPALCEPVGEAAAAAGD